MVWRKEGKAAAAAAIALSVSALSNSGHVPTILLVEGSTGLHQQIQEVRIMKGSTLDFKGLSRLGLDPLSVNVGNILLEERLVI